MKFISPHNVDLVYTSVPADANPEWDAEDNYSLGDIVKVTTSFPNKLYRSRRSNNINRQPSAWLEPITEFASSTTSLTVAAGAQTLTVETGKSFSAGQVLNLTRTTTPKSVSMACEVESYDPATGELVVSVYSVVGSGTYAVWTIASADEIGFWEEIGTTNAHSMFDEYVNTRTVNTGSIFLRMRTSGVSGVAFFGIAASSVDMKLWDATETTKLWEGSLDMVYSASILTAISDWYEYFFGEFSLKTDVSAEIPVRAQDAIMTINIVSDEDVSAMCGNIIVGELLDIGETQYGSSAGIIDYSKRTEDDFGRVSIVPGYWAKRNDFNLVIDNINVDHVYKKLAAVRGIPTAWIGDHTLNKFEMFVVFGLGEFDIVVSGAEYSYGSLSITGLI